MITIGMKHFGAELSGAASANVQFAIEQFKNLKMGACKGGEWTGWLRYADNIGPKLIKDIEAYKSSVTLSYDVVVVIGIGGSYLGTRAVSEALSNEYLLAQPAALRKFKPILYVGHHLCPDATSDLMVFLDSVNPIVNVISKSGTTTEPSVAFRLVRDYMNRRYGEGEACKRIIATTDPETGALRKLSMANGYQTFPVPRDVGGRYSVLTAVGMVPLAMAGYPVNEIMLSAQKYFADVLKCDVADLKQHAVIQYAACRKAAVDHGKVTELLAYTEPKLRNLAEWWKQLFGESEGKDGKGMFPASLALTTDLHSLGQYAQDGMRTMIESFLSFKSPSRHEVKMRVPVLNDDSDQLLYLEGKSIASVNDAARLATSFAHSQGGMPCLSVAVDEELNARSLGALIAFYETSCAVSALMLGVNPFDQPGVEAYKKYLFGLMGRRGYESEGDKVTKG